MTCSKQLLAKVNNLIHLYKECLLKQCLKNNQMIDDHKLYVGHDVLGAHTVCSASTPRTSAAGGETVLPENKPKCLDKNADNSN